MFPFSLPVVGVPRTLAPRQISSGDPFTVSAPNFPNNGRWASDPRKWPASRESAGLDVK
jgi:hypothetical protein